MSSGKYRPGPIVIERDLINSNAFIALTGIAPQILLIFLSKRQMKKVRHKGRKDEWIISNNGEIEFPYREAEKRYGITPDRFMRSLNQLIEFGFIDIAVPGGGLFGIATKYAISKRWRLFGTQEFDRNGGREKRLYQIGFCRKNEKK